MGKSSPPGPRLKPFGGREEPGLVASSAVRPAASPTRAPLTAVRPIALPALATWRPTRCALRCGSSSRLDARLAAGGVSRSGERGTVYAGVRDPSGARLVPAGGRAGAPARCAWESWDEPELDPLRPREAAGRSAARLEPEPLAPDAAFAPALAALPTLEAALETVLPTVVAGPGDEEPEEDEDLEEPEPEEPDSDEPEPDDPERAAPRLAASAEPDSRLAPVLAGGCGWLAGVRFAEEGFELPLSLFPPLGAGAL